MFKKRIGITQRVMRHPGYDEIMDCLDVRWSSFLLPMGILPVPLPLMSASYAYSVWSELKLDGLILSGGNTLAQYADTKKDSKDISVDRDTCERILLEAALMDRTPVLGVCRGLQIINIHYNGQLVKIEGHAGTRHRLFAEDATNAFELPTEVNSFHDFAIPRSHLAATLVPLAHDSNDNIEICYNSQDKIIGIMWHPERENLPSEKDRKLIREHFEL